METMVAGGVVMVKYCSGWWGEVRGETAGSGCELPGFGCHDGSRTGCSEHLNPVEIIRLVFSASYRRYSQ